MKRQVIVIPARYESSRFPGKPLQQLNGKPIIQWVHERAISTGVREVYIATDHKEIESCAKSFGANVVITNSTHQSGTERIEEVARLKQWPDDLQIINVQGDEPLINPKVVVELATLMSVKHPEMATVVSTFKSIDDYMNPNCVKVTLNQDDHAISFTRSISVDNQLTDIESVIYRHIGIYAYSVRCLKKIVRHNDCKLEQLERLEQLRALWLGIKILVLKTQAATPRGVDTLDDLNYLEDYLKNHSEP
jgi:3-deoxy-manno-octulosonate cytidylyltransferase (CMP-KDO synthetase)